MRAKSLKETNPYLKDPIKREKGLWITVSSSSAIEGVRVAKKKVTGKAGKATTRPRKNARTVKSHR